MPDPGLPKIEESKTEIVRTHGDSGRGTAGEANYVGGDARGGGREENRVPDGKMCSEEIWRGVY